MQHFSNRTASLPVLFVQASHYLLSQSFEIKELTSFILSQSPELSNRLVWRICDQCHRRCHTQLFRQGGSVLCAWDCVECGYSRCDPLDWNVRLLLLPDSPAFVPKVLLCDMIDYHILCSDLSVNYVGGLPHMLSSRKIYRSLKGSRKLFPELLWEPSGMPFVRGQDLEDLWNRGRFSSYLYHDLFGTESLKQNIAISAGNPAELWML
jgi:hypothetical protein